MGTEDEGFQGLSCSFVSFSFLLDVKVRLVAANN